jgi:polyphosphate kinase 2 (PPK2 family)
VIAFLPREPNRATSAGNKRRTCETFRFNYAICILIEGRDAAGEGGTIKAITEAFDARS